MKGAIIGDIVGSVYEFDNIKTKDFPFFRDDCFFTDDTVLTAAVGEALMYLHGDRDAVIQVGIANKLREYAKRYPNLSYGGRFRQWVEDNECGPYGSWGNGAPMRCSAAGWLAHHDAEAAALGRLTAKPTHNHGEAIKASRVTSVLIYRAQRKAYTLEELKFSAEMEYDIPRLDDIRDTYEFSESSQDTMPVALAAFFESTSFEDAIRNAISVGGDSDTIAAITGSIAEAYYGIPDEIWDKAATYLDPFLLDIVDRFYEKIGGR